MTKRIIYKNNGGGVSIIVPAPKSTLSLEEIAEKDVPTGKPYKIVGVSDIPTDRTNRDLWDVNEADLADGVGADHGVIE